MFFINTLLKLKFNRYPTWFHLQNILSNNHHGNGEKQLTTNFCCTIYDNISLSLMDNQLHYEKIINNRCIYNHESTLYHDHILILVLLR